MLEVIYRSKALSKYTRYKFILINGVHIEKPYSRRELIELSMKIDGKYNVCCLFVNSRLIFSPLHVISAVEHAARAAMDSGRDLKVEISLYLLATTQISDALKKVLSERSYNLCVVILSVDEDSAYLALNGIVETLQGSIRPEFVEESGKEKLRYQEKVFGVRLEEYPAEAEKIILEKIAISRL